MNNYLTPAALTPKEKDELLLLRTTTTAQDIAFQYILKKREVEEMLKKVITVRNQLRTESKEPLTTQSAGLQRAVRLLEQTFDLRPEKFGTKW